MHRDARQAGTTTARFEVFSPSSFFFLSALSIPALE